MARAVVLNIIVVGCFCTNCYLVLENSKALAQGNRLRMNMRREHTNTFRGLAALAAVLYVTIFSSTLSCISDAVFLCSQCTGNQACVKAFLLWNAFDIVVTLVCDVALYYLVQTVTNEGYRALKGATETTEGITTLPWDYTKHNAMEGYSSELGAVDSDDGTTVEAIISTRESHPRKVMAYIETIQLKPSLLQIVLIAILKMLVLAMFKQYTDLHAPVVDATSDQDTSSASRVSLTQITAWKAAYARRRSTLHSIQERTLLMQAEGIGEAKLARPTAPRAVGLNPVIEEDPHPDNDLKHPADHSSDHIGQNTEVPAPPASRAAVNDFGSTTKTAPFMDAREKTGTGSDGERDGRKPVDQRRVICLPTAKEVPVAEEPTISSKLYVTADEMDIAARPTSGAAGKSPR